MKRTDENVDMTTRTLRRMALLVVAVVVAGISPQKMFVLIASLLVTLALVGPLFTRLLPSTVDGKGKVSEPRPVPDIVKTQDTPSTQGNKGVKPSDGVPLIE